MKIFSLRSLSLSESIERESGSNRRLGLGVDVTAYQVLD
jgi:hypothetical protein